MDAKFSGKTALHCAAAAGKMNVVEALIELGANLECEVRIIHMYVFLNYVALITYVQTIVVFIQDEVGYRPLHHCANRSV